VRHPKPEPTLAEIKKQTQNTKEKPKLQEEPGGGGKEESLSFPLTRCYHRKDLRVFG
jgi:hypothetical protein